MSLHCWVINVTKLFDEQEICLNYTVLVKETHSWDDNSYEWEWYKPKNEQHKILQDVGLNAEKLLENNLLEIGWVGDVYDYQGNQTTYSFTEDNLLKIAVEEVKAGRASFEWDT